MSYVNDVAIIIFLFVLFAVSHSILANPKIKNKIAIRVGNNFAFYRAFYNLTALMSLVFIYEISPAPDLTIYDLKFPYDIIIYFLQVLSVVGIFWSFKVIDGSEFFGISQIKRYLNGTYSTKESDDNSELVIKGAFKYSRHPLYFFIILFLGLRPTMDLFYLTFYLCFVSYFVIGSYFEEKNLIAKFGNEYLEYQSRVPRLIPYKIFFK